MKSKESLRSIACHRLIDEKGVLHGASIVTIDTHTHQPVSIQAFQNKEYPFTEWLGGTVILFPEKELILAQHTTLKQYIAQITSLSATIHSSIAQKGESHRIYVWHTPITGLETPLPHPPVRL